MSRYSPEDEERIRLQRHVREWTRSGLLTPVQGARLESALRVDLRRVGPVLRAGLALFTVLIAGASVFLAFTVFGVESNAAIAVTTGLAAVVCFGVADWLAGRFRFYRHGVEEVLAVSAVVLLTVSAGTLVAATYERLQRDPAAVVALALAVGAASSAGLYRRFGFLYAPIGAMACAAAIPFQFDFAEPTERLLAAAVFAVSFVATRTLSHRRRDTFSGPDYATLQAFALLGIYLVLNLYLAAALPVGITPVGILTFANRPWFTWTTYVLTWIIPACGLWVGIRDKDRALIGVGGATLLVSIVTNKPYLGWPRQTWDPMLLGALLVAVAIGVRRWLTRGPGGERGGFTPEHLLEKDRDAIRLVAIASAGVRPGPYAPAASAPPPGFGGGRSGGGGGSASF